MQRQEKPAARIRHLRSLGACLLAGWIAGCDSPKAQSSPGSSTAREAKLAVARIDLAKSRPADEALALLVSALKADPQSGEARNMAADIVSQNRWHLPEIILDHRQPIDQFHFAPPSSLWVSLSGETNTTLRWNLESLQIEATLFPLKAVETRSLTIDPTLRSMVVERAGVTLLCNAQTLKPIRDLGLLPEIFAPSAVIVFSDDGLLLAHPAVASKDDPALVWHIRDATSGEIVRKSEPAGQNHPRPLAAFLDRHQLRVLQADGSLFEMPVSPAEQVRATPAAEAIALIDAQFAKNGAAALVSKHRGPHLAPELCIMSFSANEDTSLDAASLLGRFPWTRHPSIWTGLLRDPELARLNMDGKSATILAGQHAPIHAESTITALAISGDKVIIGEQCGRLTIHRTLSVPHAKTATPQPWFFEANALTALQNLCEALAGIRYDETSRTFPRSDTARRLQALKECDFDALLRIFPALDFSPVLESIKAMKTQPAGAGNLAVFHERMARAFGESKTPEVEKAFEGADEQTVLAAIQAAGKNGAAAANALELALASTHPQWIEACLAQAVDLPPLLQKLAVSRIAWLQDRKADALAGWPDVFPDLKYVLLREDWDGWEQADFSQALEKLRLGICEELSAIEVPEKSTPGQRKAVFDRLTDPATVQAVGKARYAKACLTAALAFSSFKEESTATFKLATIARNLGQPPAPCLRAEAMSLTALGDYQKAHGRWITLITEHPVASQEPGDYAEAAYTAFENADPQQAMAILTTGLHRFPNDGNFALRAGWVALLTGNSERAYRFLLTGRQIGYPEEKIENATALMAIAAVQTGAAEDAAVFYQDLIRLDPAWENPDTIETLEWPEDMKASLRQLAW